MSYITVSECDIYAPRRTKHVHVSVRVCVYVAGTELSHLCVVMTNQHVN